MTAGINEGSRRDVRRGREEMWGINGGSRREASRALGIFFFCYSLLLTRLTMCTSNYFMISIVLRTIFYCRS